MIRFLNEPYPDEIAYSWFTRYSKINGNYSYTETSRELFGLKSVASSVHYPVYLKYFASQLPPSWNMTEEVIIDNYSIFPLFMPFMNTERASKVVRNMMDGNTKNIAGEMGLYTGNLFITNGRIAKICPECFKEEKKSYGEAYLHRIHQVPGSFYCAKHNKYLIEQEIPASLNKYYFFDINSINSDLLSAESPPEILKKYYFNLYEDIKTVLNGALKGFNIDSVREKYHNRLREKGYLINNNMRQKKIQENFIKFYPKEFLLKTESYIDKTNFKWMKVMLTNTINYVHPIRHLLFIRFLFGGINQFANYHFEYKPFGDAPYPCLNPVSSHYNELVIPNCEIKRTNNIREVVGVFKCSCGFIYHRSGPDRTPEDKYKGRVQDYGHVWKAKLKQLVLENNLSIIKMAKEMKCGTNTIVKYSTELGIVDKLNTTLRLESKEYSKRKTEEEYLAYKSDILQYIEENKDATRQQIKKALTKQYGLIYLREKEWLDSVLPKPYIAGTGFAVDYKDINWEQKDLETLSLVKNAIDNILAEDKPHRITKTYIAKQINYFGIVQENVIKKLPKTEKLLSEQCETVEQYKQRIHNSSKK